MGEEEGQGTAEARRSEEKGGGSAGSGKAPAKSAGGNRKWIVRGIVAAIVLAVVIVVASSGDDGNGDGAVTEELASTVVSAEELSEQAAEVDYPVYWAGPMPGTELELTRGSDGSFLIRYLPEGVSVGEGTASTLSLGTYPLADPENALANAASGEDAIVRDADGRQAVSSESRPTSVYFVDPDNTVQVEVYDPSPARAMRLALSERVQPVE